MLPRPLVVYNILRRWRAHHLPLWEPLELRALHGHGGRMSDERLFSGKEAATLLGMSLAWLYQSDVPHVRLGRRRLYRSTDLRSYISRQIRN